MKPYQHHDELADQGKADPKPKRPTQATHRGSRTHDMGRPRTGLEKHRFRCCLHGHGTGRSVA